MSVFPSADIQAGSPSDAPLLRSGVLILEAPARPFWGAWEICCIADMWNVSQRFFESFDAGRTDDVIVLDEDICIDCALFVDILVTGFVRLVPGSGGDVSESFCLC